MRSLTLYKVAGNAIHAFELSLPNTGKTTFGIRNQFAFNWAYVDEVPSYARLIMDARNGALGLVFRSNGVFIDEIDKYNCKHERDNTGDAYWYVTRCLD